MHAPDDLTLGVVVLKNKHSDPHEPATQVPHAARWTTQSTHMCRLGCSLVSLAHWLIRGSFWLCGVCNTVAGNVGVNRPRTRLPVYLRVLRPTSTATQPLNDAASPTSCGCLSLTATHAQIQGTRPKFGFKHVFAAATGASPALFEAAAKPTIDAALNGSNATLLVYDRSLTVRLWQLARACLDRSTSDTLTSSQKQGHELFGSSKARAGGIVGGACNHIFNAIHEQSYTRVHLM